MLWYSGSYLNWLSLIQLWHGRRGCTASLLPSRSPGSPLSPQWKPRWGSSLMLDRSGSSSSPCGLFWGGLITSGRWWKSWLSTKLPLTSPHEEGGDAASLMPGGGRYSGAQHGLHWHRVCVWVHYRLAGMKVPVSYLAFSDTILVEVLGYLITALWGRSQGSPLGLC